MAFIDFKSRVRLMTNKHGCYKIKVQSKRVYMEVMNKSNTCSVFSVP